jgi:hypothetical protein
MLVLVYLAVVKDPTKASYTSLDIPTWTLDCKGRMVLLPTT